MQCLTEAVQSQIYKKASVPRLIASNWIAAGLLMSGHHLTPSEATLGKTVVDRRNEIQGMQRMQGTHALFAPSSADP
eukprot:CAMPEP_0179016826 /NCGR_PEP_ID=MMETSP0796-20121207/3523_1 /TAXON_ID=73915 /ORGANISM="Pyrodinium bahamense, Strain pbaha01" /LENGTH=76 /DNA_ID=CAMNT_0020712535 /DNA_START=242 /DNA_END=469 /DNA_ORIENTATION=-